MDLEPVIEASKQQASVIITAGLTLLKRVRWQNGLQADKAKRWMASESLGPELTNELSYATGYIRLPIWTGKERGK